MMENLRNKYLFSIGSLAFLLIILSPDGKIFAQNEFNNYKIDIIDENEIQNFEEEMFEQYFNKDDINRLFSPESKSSFYENEIPYYTEEQNTFESYIDSLNRFSLMYPKDWYAYEDEKGNLRIESPKENETDPYLDVFLVSTSNISQINYLQNESLPFDRIVESELNNLELVNDFQLIESDIINLYNINYPAHKFVYTYSDSDIGNAKALDILLKKDDQLYYLTYIAKPTDYSKNLPLILDILESFEFTNSNKFIVNNKLDLLNEPGKGTDNSIDENLEKYYKQLSRVDINNILLDLKKSLSNSIFNDTSLFSVFSYSLVNNVKLTGAKINDNNSINVTLEYDNKINFTSAPSVAVVLYKLELNMKDIYSYLISSGLTSGDFIQSNNNNNQFALDKDIPFFDLISNLNVGSNVIGPGWNSPLDISIKVQDKELMPDESDTSLLLIQLIPIELT